MKRLLPVLILFLAAVGCYKEKQQPSDAEVHNLVRLSFSIAEPDFEDENGTKVTLEDGGAFQWTGTETASVIVGKEETSTTKKTNGLQIELPSKAPGVFEGTIDLGSFSEEDVKGIVIPHAAGAYYYYNSGNKQYRFYIPISNSQTQTENGVLNPTYCPFIAASTFDGLSTGGTPLQLQSAGALLRFNVYGKHAQQSDGEVLKSIRVDEANSKVISGRCEWIYNTSGSFNSNGSSYVTASLTEPCTIADKTQANGVKLFAGVVLAGSRTLGKITVTTDRAVYTKTISKSLSAKKVTTKTPIYRLGVNLAGSGWTRESRVFYSTDGGSTWQENLPEGEWTSLAVKTSDAGTLSKEALTEIATAIAAKTDPVDLDLSEAEYISATFPNVFKGTADTPYTKLASITFPSNVTTIDESAFEWCAGLESVELEGITTINTKAFYHSGLVNLTVPSTVSKMEGWLTFGCCPNLSTVYYDATAQQVGGNGSSGTNHAHFAWATMTSATNNPAEVTDTYNSPNYPLVFTVGPNCSKIVRYMFKYNKKLTTLVFKSSPALSNYAFGNTPYLETFDFSTVSAAPDNDYPGSSVGTSVASGTTKRILVPQAAVDTYAATRPWKDYVENAGYVLTGISTSQGSGSIQARVGSYNIRTTTTESDSNNNWANRKERFFQSFRNIDFDMVGLQEVTATQLTDLKDEFSDTYDFYVLQTGSGGVGGAWKKDKYNLLSSGLYWINPKDINSKAAYDKPTTGTYAGKSFYRACTGMLLEEKTTHIKFLFMATHYCLSAESREAYAYLYPQFEAAWNPYGFPSFLVGDLNAKPEDPCHTDLGAYWTDTYTSAASKGGIVNTYNGYTAPEGKSRLDYIYWRGTELTPTYYECDNTLYGSESNLYPSDHFPVFADFTITVAP